MKISLSKFEIKLSCDNILVWMMRVSSMLREISVCDFHPQSMSLFLSPSLSSFHIFLIYSWLIRDLIYFIYAQRIFMQPMCFGIFRSRLPKLLLQTSNHAAVIEGKCGSIHTSPPSAPCSIQYLVLIKYETAKMKTDCHITEIGGDG